jgi:hypothetical protein
LHARTRTCRELVGFLHAQLHQDRAGIVVGRPRALNTQRHLSTQAVDLLEQRVRLRPVRVVEPHNGSAKQRRLVGEMAVQPTTGYPGRLGDLRHRRRSNSLGAHADFGRIDQAIANTARRGTARHSGIVPRSILSFDKVALPVNSHMR